MSPGRQGSLRGSVAKTRIGALVEQNIQAPTPVEYERHGRYQYAYAEDLSTRAIQSFSANDAGLITAAVAGLGYWGASHAVDRHLRPGPTAGFGARIGFGIDRIGIPAAVAAATMVAGKAGISALDHYANLDSAITQFDRMDSFRAVSNQMMAGSGADPVTGRMNRREAFLVNTFLESTERGGRTQRNGDTIEDLHSQVGTLSEFRLLEGVRDAEDFQKKFAQLRDGVKRMSQILGTTFQEGAQMMAEFRSMGVSPERVPEVMRFTRAVAAGHNLAQGQVQAAGMRGSLAVMGSGLEATAGYAMGAEAEGLGKTMWERGLISDRAAFNLGGPQNLGIALQRAQMNFVQSAPFQLTVASAYTSTNGRGELDMGLAAEVASGRMTLQQALSNVGSQFDSPEAMLEWRASKNRITSQLIESNPAAISAMAVSQVIGFARDGLGLDVGRMTKEQLAQLAPSVIGGTTDEFLAQVAAVQAAGEGLGRAEMREQAVDEARFRDRVRYGVVGQVGEFMRTNPFTLAAHDLGDDWSQGLRSWTFNLQRGASDLVATALTGQYRVEQGGALVELNRMGRSDAERARTRGRGRNFRDHHSRLNDTSDNVIRQMQAEGEALDGVYDATGFRAGLYLPVLGGARRLQGQQGMHVEAMDRVRRGEEAVLRQGGREVAVLQASRIDELIQGHDPIDDADVFLSGDRLSAMGLRAVYVDDLNERGVDRTQNRSESGFQRRDERDRAPERRLRGDNRPRHTPAGSFMPIRRRMPT